MIGWGGQWQPINSTHSRFIVTFDSVSRSMTKKAELDPNLFWSFSGQDIDFGSRNLYVYAYAQTAPYYMYFVTVSILFDHMM
jgi:hypothetical protein